MPTDSASSFCEIPSSNRRALAFSPNFMPNVFRERRIYVASLRKTRRTRKRSKRKTLTVTQDGVSASLSGVPAHSTQSQYPLDDVRNEVEDVLLAIEEEHGQGLMKQAAAAVGVNEQEFSRKRKAKTPGRYFNFIQLGRLAKWIPQHFEPLPPGWPFIRRVEWPKIVATVQTTGSGSPRGKQPQG